MPLTQKEIANWLEWLPFEEKHIGANTFLRPCRSDQERITVIKDLLVHANEDTMTEEDRCICRNALKDLEDRAILQALEVHDGVHSTRSASRDHSGLDQPPSRPELLNLHDPDDLSL